MNFQHDFDTQHARLRILADRLTLLSRSDPEFLPPERWLPVVAPDLRALTDALEHHFAFEERGGYMNEVLRRDPNRNARAEELLAEHGRLREALATLAGQLGPEVDRRDFVQRLEVCLETLHDHEAAEVEFFQRGLLRDLGVGD